MYNNRTINEYLSTSSLLTNLCLHWQIIWTSHGSINFCEMLLIKLLRWTRSLEKKFSQTLTCPKAAVALLNPSTAVVVTDWVFSSMKFLIMDPRPELSSLPSQWVEAATWGRVGDFSQVHCHPAWSGAYIKPLGHPVCMPPLPVNCWGVPHVPWLHK